MKKILVTGSSGLIGSEVSLHFAAVAWKVHGVDNNQRAVFFAPQYVDENRIGDHICYYSNLSKMRKHYPGWDITISLKETIGQIVGAWKTRT